MTLEITLKSNDIIPACSKNDLEKMQQLTEFVETLDQVDVPTDHFIHAGCYVRTCLARKGVLFTAAEIKVPTVVVINGKGTIFSGGKKARVNGYLVLRGEAHRQIAYVAEEDTYFTMFYATKKTNADDCEFEFTDQADKLITRRQKCQERQQRLG